MKITSLIRTLSTLILILNSKSHAITENTLEEDAQMYINISTKYGKTSEQISTELRVSTDDLRKFRQNSYLPNERRESILNTLRPNIIEYNRFVDKIIDCWPSIPVNPTHEVEEQLFELAYRLHLPIKYTHSNFLSHNERDGGTYGADSRIISKCIKKIMIYRESNPQTLTREVTRRFTRIGQKVATRAFHIDDIAKLSEALKAYPSNTTQLFIADIVSALDLDHINVIDLLHQLNTPNIWSYEKKFLFEVTVASNRMRKALADSRDQYINANAEQVVSGLEDFFQGYSY